ncbi:MAG: hypothetical protein AAF430_23015 [Myxococcota bacterium]
MAVRSFIRFEAKPGKGAELERIYLEGKFLERARVLPGFLGGDFVCLDRSTGHYAATALWDSEVSYQRWQEIGPAETPKEWRDALLRVVTKFEPGVAWDVLHEVGSEGATPS